MRREGIVFLALFILLGISPSFGDDISRGRPLWTDPDGSPDQTPFSEVTVSSGTLADDGDGTATLTTGGSGAPADAEYVVTEANGTLSAEIAPSAANQVPNSTSSTAGSWTATPTVQSATLSHTIPSLVFTDTTASEDDFEIVLDGDGAYFADTTDSVIAWMLNSQNSLKLGEVGKEIASLSVHTTNTGDSAVQLPLNSIGPQELDAIDEPADGEIYSFDSATGRGEWAVDGGGGGGSPGGSGSELQYRGGASTFSAVTSSSVSGANITLAGDLDLNYSVPVLKFTDTTSGANDYEIYGDNDSLFLTDTTTGLEILRYQSNGTTAFPSQTWDFTNTTRKGIRPPREYWWTASSLEPLEAAESIPPISKFTGTNIDIITASFDDSTDEGRKVSFKVPSDVDTSGGVTFRVLWFSRTATSGNVRWDFRYTGTGTQGESWDQSLSTAYVVSAVQGTTNQMTVSTLGPSFSSLGWAANDLITVMLYRDANHATDTMVGDAEIVGVGIEVART